MEDKECKGLTLRSSEVQEVMGQVPGWILRWGITVVAIVVAMIGAGSFFFRYPEKVVVHVAYTSACSPVRVSAPADGVLYSLMVAEGRQVSKGMPIAEIDTGGGCLPVVSPANGIVEMSAPCADGFAVNKGSCLMSILPAHRGKTVCYGYISSDEHTRVRAGQTAYIRLSGSLEHEYGVIPTKVSHISTVPDARAGYYVAFHIPDTFTMRSGKKVSSAALQTETVEVIVNNRRLIEKFLPRLPLEMARQ